MPQLGHEIKGSSKLIAPPVLIPIEQCTTSKGFWALQLDERFWTIHSHRPCQHNELRALYQRVLMPVLTPNQSAIVQVGATMKNYADLIEHNTRSTTPPSNSRAVEASHSIVIPGCPIDHDFLVEKCFPVAKRGAYRRALQDLRLAPLKPGDAFVTGFVKAEKLKIVEKDGDPRLIQFRSQRFNLELGAYTRAIEKQLYNLRNDRGERFIVKGLCEYKRAQLMHRAWLSYENPAAMAFDLSRWDAHCSEALIDQLHQFYLRLCPSPHFKTLLQYQRHNKGRTQGGWRYSTRGGVMSGDMTTALGNCVMLCAMVDTLIDRLGLRGRLTLIDDGDDHCLIGNLPDVQRYAAAAPDWFALLGHDLKVEGFATDFCDILFCQHHPILLPNGSYKLMPDPKKVLSTSFYIPGAKYKTLSEAKIARAYLHEVWYTRAILHSGMPILGPLFWHLARSAHDWREQHWDSNMKRTVDWSTAWKNQPANAQVPAHIQNARLNIRLGASKDKFPSYCVEPSCEARVQVAQVYGISIDEQLYFESMRLGGAIPSPKHITGDTLDAWQQEGPMQTIIRVGGEERLPNLPKCERRM